MPQRLYGKEHSECGTTGNPAARGWLLLIAPYLLFAAPSMDLHHNDNRVFVSLTAASEALA